MNSPSNNQTREQQQQPEKGDAVPALYRKARKLLNVEKIDTYSKPGNRLLAALIAYGCRTFQHFGGDDWIAGDAWLCFNFDKLAAAAKCDVLQVPTMLAFLELGGYIKTEVCGPITAKPRTAAYVKLTLGESAKVA